jgi:IS605 OrfB family transposase
LITIKLKIQNEIDIFDIQKQWNNCYRVAYNRFTEDYADKEVDSYLSNLNNIELLDKSMRQSIRKKAKTDYSTNEIKNPIFGGKLNFTKRKYKEISNEEYKKNRLHGIWMIGDKNSYSGNRKFKLDIIKNNTIIFKPNSKTKIPICLNKLSKENKKLLYKLEELCENKLACFTVELNEKFICITFEESILKTPRDEFVKGRVLAFDMNPNYIGITIKDNDKEIIYKEVLDASGLTEFIKGKTDRKYQNRKRKYETFQTAKHISNLAKHYKVEVVVFEKLDMKPQEHNKGKKYNRLVNNDWNRKDLVNNIKKRCNINDITYIEIYPQYSSFIGCLLNPKETDSIAASLELSRRGYLYNKKYITKEISGDCGIMYPEFNLEELSTHWKEMIDSCNTKLKTWKALKNHCNKNPKYSYRILFKDWCKTNPVKSFSLLNRRSKVIRNILSIE